ncbi:MAG: DUF2804 domain-containing protein [Deltaproteobacteria bacterium]|nr:DUF2804 domain-containing protein [Deltaproteobacteria bacterium]
MTREAKPTPPRMVEAGRVVEFGHFREEFRDLNISDADIFGIGALGRLVNPFRLKEWQHFAIFNDEVLLTFVIVNTHYLSNSFCYVVDRRTGEMTEHHREAPPWTARVAKGIHDDHCEFRVRGYDIDVKNRLDEKRHDARIAIAPGKKTPGIDAAITMHADPDQHPPLVVVLRLADNRPAYSHKMACPVSGRVCVGEREYAFDPRNSLALIDVHKAYYPYRMTWSWASGAGFAPDGRVIGFNLTHNCVKDDGENNENAIWIGDRLTVLPAARFTFNEHDLRKPWRVATTDGRCDVEFFPSGERRGRINLGVVASDYHQPFGVFRGHAIDDDGKTHHFHDVFGVTERHHARF